LKLIQIPFSHNCIKVRVALARKRLAYDVEDIPPSERGAVARASGQRLVPVLVDDGRTVTDSTAILLYLEERYPEPPLVPKDPRARAECLLLEDWADRTFMAASRRIGYFHVLARRGQIGTLFFPGSRGLKRSIQERVAKRIVTKRFRISRHQYEKDLVDMRAAAALAIARLGEGPYLFGGELTIADIALASMCAPLVIDAELAKDSAVRALLAWAEPIVGRDVMDGYR
jgi:glutathione S-transferase